MRPGEVWEVAFRAANPGVWMSHCHNLAHASQRMALHLRYEGVTSPFHGGHGGRHRVEVSRRGGASRHRAEVGLRRRRAGMGRNGRIMPWATGCPDFAAI
ncbi:multicopper oxidase domain-containing protein [Streptosporangium sp. NPDC049046]|uniref:multicopper oxidase domain-containing protein n=1 Tax=Streptosporangium sp. NPDC049046 TaxID=3155031 RepID=UPI003420788F